MKKSLSVIFLLALSAVVFAQTRVIQLNKVYPKAKIYQHGKGTIAAQEMSLINDTLLSFQSRTSDGSFRSRQLSTANVRYVKLKRGSYAGIGAAAGAGIGLLCAAYVQLLDDGVDYYDEVGSDINWTPVYLGCIAGGAVIGAISCMFIPKWKTFFLPDRSTSYTIKISPAISPYYCGIGVRVKF